MKKLLECVVEFPDGENFSEELEVSWPQLVASLLICFGRTITLEVCE